ncbi:MAG: thiamine diphosphokinase [Ignavibacteriales bacterium]|nr:thiamine diphosphokinase [Ignavibacteriales bacterium]
MKKCIILANGFLPSKNTVKFLQDKGYKTLLCADGGANSAKILNLIPKYIIGDLDSIRPDVYEYYSNKCDIIKINRQNDTDVEKCLKFVMKKRYNEVILLGATGDRLDHSFCNLGIVLKYFNKIKILIIHQKSLLSAYTGNIILTTIPNEIISLYGFDFKTRVKSSGLKYPLKNITLPFGQKESTSNIAVNNKVQLQIKGGIIFVIRDFDLLEKHGLF